MKKILITDKETGQLKFSAKFDDESLETILTLLSKVHDFSYVKIENGIII